MPHIPRNKNTLAMFFLPEKLKMRFSIKQATVRMMEHQNIAIGEILKLNLFSKLLGLVFLSSFFGVFRFA